MVSFKLLIITTHDGIRTGGGDISSVSRQTGPSPLWFGSSHRAWPKNDTCRRIAGNGFQTKYR